MWPDLILSISLITWFWVTVHCPRPLTSGLRSHLKPIPRPGVPPHLVPAWRGHWWSMHGFVTKVTAIYIIHGNTVTCKTTMLYQRLGICFIPNSPSGMDKVLLTVVNRILRKSPLGFFYFTSDWGAWVLRGLKGWPSEFAQWHFCYASPQRENTSLCTWQPLINNVRKKDYLTRLFILRNLLMRQWMVCFIRFSEPQIQITQDENTWQMAE